MSDDAARPVRRAGVQSVEVGAGLLRALADAQGPQSLSALARAAGMGSAKAHRYLVSFVQSGLAVQSESGGAYDLGPLAVRLGLAAVERYDVVRLAAERLPALRDAVDATVMLSVWTDAGPAVARIALSSHPVTLAVRVGTAFPLVTTATGRIFLAFHREPTLGRRVEEELGAFRAARVDGVPADEPAVTAEIEHTRTRGLARVDQTFLVGVSAMAAPLLDAAGTLAAAVTAIGRPDTLDLAWDGTLARALVAFTQDDIFSASQD